MYRLAQPAPTRDAMLALAGIIYALAFVAGVVTMLGRLIY